MYIIHHFERCNYGQNCASLFTVVYDTFRILTFANCIIYIYSNHDSLA